MTTVPSTAASARVFRPPSSIITSAGTQQQGQQQKAPVFEYSCMYTHDVRRKNQKRWKDGFLRLHTFNMRVLIYDSAGGSVGATHVRAEDEVQDGEEFHIDGGSCLVQVGEFKSRGETDVSAVIKQKQPQAAVRQQLQPVCANTPTRTPSKTKWTGQARLPEKSPFELRRLAEEDQEPTTKRQRRDDSQHVPLFEVLRTSKHKAGPAVSPSSLKLKQKQKQKTPLRQTATRQNPSQGTFSVRELIDITSSPPHIPLVPTIAVEEPAPVPAVPGYHVDERGRKWFRKPGDASQTACTRAVAGASRPSVPKQMLSNASVAPIAIAVTSKPRKSPPPKPTEAPALHATPPPRSSSPEAPRPPRQPSPQKQTAKPKAKGSIRLSNAEPRKKGLMSLAALQPRPAPVQPEPRRSPRRADRPPPFHDIAPVTNTDITEEAQPPAAAEINLPSAKQPQLQLQPQPRQSDALQQDTPRLPIPQPLHSPLRRSHSDTAAQAGPPRLAPGGAALGPPQRATRPLRRTETIQVMVYGNGDASKATKAAEETVQVARQPQGPWTSEAWDLFGAWPKEKPVDTDGASAGGLGCCGFERYLVQT